MIFLIQFYQVNALVFSDALEGLASRIKWNRPPKGFEKFFKDKPTGNKTEPLPKEKPSTSTPKENVPKVNNLSNLKK